MRKVATLFFALAVSVTNGFATANNPEDAQSKPQAPADRSSTARPAIDPINDTTFAQVLSPGPGGAAPSLIRWDLALSNGTGRYTPTLVIDGITTPVRERDGLHFLPAGAELLAEFTFDQMRGAPSPPTPWGPFPSMGVITRYLLERTFGQVPYDYDAVRPLARPLRNGDEDWRAHIVRLVDSRRWGRTASPVARLYRAAFGRAPDAGGLTLSLIHI